MKSCTHIEDISYMSVSFVEHIFNDSVSEKLKKIDNIPDWGGGYSKYKRNLVFVFRILFNNDAQQMSFNRRFPRSMRSQGKRPGCGSHVKRVDHGDALNA